MLWNYETLSMKDDESVDAFASRVMTLVNGIRVLGKNQTEASVVRRFLCAAPPRYMQIVTAIEQCVDLTTLTVNDLVVLYKAHDERVQNSFGDAHGDEKVMLTRAQEQAQTPKRRRASRDQAAATTKTGHRKSKGRSTRKMEFLRKRSLIKEKSSATIAGSWDPSNPSARSQ